MWTRPIGHVGDRSARRLLRSSNARCFLWLPAPRKDAKETHRRQITGPNCPPCVHTHAPWRHQHLPSPGPLVPAHKNDSPSLRLPPRRHRTGPAPLEAAPPSIPSPTQTRGDSSRGEGGASPCWLERDVDLKWVLLLLCFCLPKIASVSRMFCFGSYGLLGLQQFKRYAG